MTTWTVWGLDVWGHSGEDCEESCDCEDTSAHDDTCDRHANCEGFSVNDRSRVGTIELESLSPLASNASSDAWRAQGLAEDAAMLAALIDSGFLRSTVTLDAITIEGSDGFIMIDDATTGEPLFQLECDV